MTSKRRKRKEEQWEQDRHSFTASVIEDLRNGFPMAVKWVVFSFVQAQREVGIGNESERITHLDALWEKFRANEENYPEHSPHDVLVSDSLAQMKEYLTELYDSHDLSASPLCYMADQDSEALVAYEYFWTE